jgi:hypothetical protein
MSGRSRWGAVVVVAFATACSSPAVSEAKGKKKKAETMTNPSSPSSSKDLLDRVDEIARNRPFNAKSVEKLTGAALAKVETESNDYFTVFRTDARTPLFSVIEVRAPTDKSEGSGGLVLLDVADGCVKKEEVGDRFGSAEIAPPSPHMPAGSPTYLVFRQGWGVLRLGFNPETNCLSRVVLDAT